MLNASMVVSRASLAGVVVLNCSRVPASTWNMTRNTLVRYVVISSREMYPSPFRSYRSKTLRAFSSMPPPQRMDRPDLSSAASTQPLWSVSNALKSMSAMDATSRGSCVDGPVIETMRPKASRNTPTVMSAPLVHSSNASNSSCGDTWPIPVKSFMSSSESMYEAT